MLVDGRKGYEKKSCDGKKRLSSSVSDLIVKTKIDTLVAESTAASMGIEGKNPSFEYYIAWCWFDSQLS